VPEQVAAAWALLPGYLSQHVLLSACALALGVVLSLPLAVLAARKPALRWGVLAAAGLIQTIPGLALLALFYPLLLALGAVLRVDLPALGFLPALLALTLYSMLPILRNAVAGLTGVDADVREAADGVGMTPSQRLWRVEAPLAAPVVMAGVRTAAVWTIGTATLATPVGQVSLGNYIFSGLQTENWVFVLFGCAAAAILALAADALLGLVEAGAARRSGRLAMLGLAGLFAGVAVALWAGAGVGAGSGSRYVVGAKNFSEQFILAEAITKRLSSAGAAVERRDGLGSAVAFRALAAGDLDVYVDYSGTLWANVLGRTDAVGRPAMLDILRRELKARYGVTGGGVGLTRSRWPREGGAPADARGRSGVPQPARVDRHPRRLWPPVRRLQILQSNLHVPSGQGWRSGRDFRILIGRKDCGSGPSGPGRSKGRHPRV
jgi:osmoprotectant transport system permease protein